MLPPPTDPDLALSLAYVPAARRAALAAVWALDERLAQVTAEPNAAIAAIKLAWWREALERLDTAPPPAEPLLVALASHVVGTGERPVTGERLSGVAAGWDVLLDDADEPPAARLVRHAEARGTALFAIAADLLGTESGDRATAGAWWALATVPVVLAAAAAPEAAAMLRDHRLRRWPRRLRTLGVLAGLGRARLATPTVRAGTPGQAARALWLGFTGR